MDYDMTALLIAKKTVGYGLSPYIETQKWLATLAAIRSLPTPHGQSHRLS